MNNQLYQKLRSKKSSVVLNYIFAVVIMAILLIPGIAFCYMAYAEGDIGAMTVSAIILMGLVTLVGWLEIKSIRHKKQLNIRREERIKDLTESDFEMLENEILSTELRYKSFYFLKEYVYAPKAALLLRYEAIGQWKTVRHTTNYIPDAAWVELTDTSGCMQKINIRQWRQYLMELDSTNNELNARIQQARERLG